MKVNYYLGILLFLILLTSSSSFAAIGLPLASSDEVGLAAEIPIPEHIRNEYQLAQLLFNKGYFKAAIRHWRIAASAYRDSGDQANYAILLHKIASAQRAMGLNDRAIQGLQVAIKLAKENDLNSILPMMFANLGGAYLSMGDVEVAKKWLHEARVTALLDNQLAIEASVLNDMGSIKAYNEDYANALKDFRRAATLAVDNSRLLIAAKAETNAILAALKINQFDTVKSNLQAAALHLTELNQTYQVVTAGIKLAEAASKALRRNTDLYSEHILDINTLLNRGVAYAIKVDNTWLASQILGTLAGLYQSVEQYDDALVLNSKAVKYAQQIDSTELLYRWERQAGQIYAAKNDVDSAIQAYRLAVNALQPIRHQLTMQNIGKFSFMGIEGGVYLELADLLLQKSSTVQEPKKIADYLFEARDTVELQKEAELQDYFKDRCVADVKQQITQIDDTIASDTVVLYPILFPDRAELLVSYAGSIKRYTVPVKYDEITENVRALRIKLEKLTTRQYLPYARNLYNWLIAPIEPDLQAKNITTIVVIAGQSLRTIPMSVLHDGNEFLINKYALATTPGLKLTDPRPLRRGELKVLLTGLSESVQGFPPLNYVKGELDEIQDIYISKLLFNRAFVTKSISDSLQESNYAITHIASHSVFSGDINDSYILTYDSKITVNQLGQLANISHNRNRPIELLTLSACQTAAGDDRAALGLAGVAVKSGARSALASLWSINDRASSILVAEFYRQLLHENISKAEALKLAQAKLMKDVRYRHPGYWSPFLLIGNWL